VLDESINDVVRALRLIPVLGIFDRHLEQLLAISPEGEQAPAAEVK